MRLNRRYNLDGDQAPTSSFVLNEDSILAQGLVAWYPIQGDGSSEIRDLSGNGQHGSLENMGPTNTVRSGHKGHALNYNGSDEVVNLGAGGKLEMGTSDFSVSIWFTNTSSGFSYLFSKGGGLTGRQGYGISQTSGDLYGFIHDGTRLVFPAKTATVDDGKTHLYTGIFDRSANFTPVLDGVALGSTDISARNGSVTDATNNAYISGLDVLSFGFFAGVSWDLMIHDRALPFAEARMMHSPETRHDLKYELGRVLHFPQATASATIPNLVGMGGLVGNGSLITGPGGLVG